MYNMFIVYIYLQNICVFICIHIHLCVHVCMCVYTQGLAQIMSLFYYKIFSYKIISM